MPPVSLSVPYFVVQAKAARGIVLLFSVVRSLLLKSVYFENVSNYSHGFDRSVFPLYDKRLSAASLVS